MAIGVIWQRLAGALSALRRRLIKIETFDVVALRLDEMSEPPDLRGFRLKVLTPHLGTEEVRRIVDESIPPELREKDFVQLVERGNHLYLLYDGDRWVHYNFYGTNCLPSAIYVPPPGDPVSFDSWTIDDYRGQRLFPLSLQLMGWHAKQAGYKRLYGAVALWNKASAHATRYGGLEVVGRYTVWFLPRLVVRIEHKARGLRRYRFWYSKTWWDTSKEHGPPLPDPAPVAS